MADLLFISVERRCLVRYSAHSPHVQYAVLSYVWGVTGNPLQTALENSDHLCEEGALDHWTDESLISRTIIHSIMLTQALGLRYLWVDRFCIVQDGRVRWAFRPSGLFACYPRREAFKQFDFRSNCCMVDPVSMEYSYEEPKYHQRGWTFQEWVLSYRILVFHDQAVS
jgi:hypothetical protein